MSVTDFSDPGIIAALTEALTSAGVDGVEISGPGGHLRIVVSSGQSAQVTVAGGVQPGSAVAFVKAPIAGHFAASHSLDADQAEAMPRRVSDRDVLGLIRIGSILLPVSAGRSGLLTRRLVEHDALVGFGDALFEIEPQS